MESVAPRSRWTLVVYAMERARVLLQMVRVATAMPMARVLWIVLVSVVTLVL
jgi:hypothetical protein